MHIYVMKHLSIVAVVAAASAISAPAQLNSSASQGYMARGMEMLAVKNYSGCIDQLTRVDRATLSPEALERMDWALAEAAFGTSGAAAMPHFRHFLAAYPYSLLRARAQMRVADCLFTQSYPEALKAYLEVDPDALDADRREDLDYRIAYCMLQTGSLDMAAKHFARLTATKRYGAAARFYCGYIAYASGDYSEAERMLAQADTHSAPGDMAPYYLAQIYYRTARYDKALAQARTLLRRRGVRADFTAEANRIAGESLYQTGQYAEAIPYLRRYVGADESPLPSALYILGLAEYAEADYDTAIDHLGQATGADDAMAQSAYLYIGQAMMHRGDTQAAVLAFDKAMRMAHDPAVQETACYNYAVARMQGGTVPFGSSVRAFEEFLQRFPGSDHAAQVQEYIVTGYLTDNDYDSALASIQRMRNPSQRVLGAKQRILYTLGSRKLAGGDAATAASLLRQADALASAGDEATARETRLALGEALYLTGDYDAAAGALLDYLRRTPAATPNAAVARYDLGYVRFAQKRYADAAENFSIAAERGASLSPEATADAFNRLADTYYYASDFDTAEKYYDKAYATYPSAGDYALFQKGVMQGYRRNHKAKTATLARMRSEFPSSGLVPDALLETTESQIQTGDNAGAIATYRELIAAYPGTAQGRKGHLQLAQTLLNAGRRAEATDTYRDIVRAYPTSAEAAEAAEALKRISADDGTLQQHMEFLASVDGAPRMDVGEADRLSYDAADKALVTASDPSRMLAYLRQYPDGAFRPRAHESLMLHYSAAGDHAAALAQAEEIISRYPDHSAAEAALALKADDDYAAGRGEAALRHWRMLEQKASSAARLNAARMGIMRVGRDIADYTLVEQAADALLASSTLGAENRTEATFSKALALDARGQRDEARSLWASIADATDELYGAKAAYSLAQSLFDDGQTDRARTRTEALTASGTPHAYWLARGFILLSDIYAAQGKNFEAREYLNALRDNYPGSETDIIDMIDTRLSKLKKQ